MQAMKTRDATVTPNKDGLPRLARWYQAQSPEAGRKAISTVLFSAAIAHRRPKSIHGFMPSRSSMVRVSQKIMATSRAEKLVSHTQRVHQYITWGSSAQVHAEPTATFSLKILRAIRKIGMQVRAEKMLLMVSRMNAEDRE